MAQRVIVVGAGAAGIFAALRAAELGAQVDILEKTNRIGTKILISGGGKCNVGHAGPIEEVLRAFRPHEARFIRPACYRMPNTAIIERFTGRGLEVYTRPNGRIFPTHGTAKDVVAILRDLLDEAGVRVHLETPVDGLMTDEKGICGVRAGGKEWLSRRVVVSVGGSSYPASGTTGDGFKWVRELGHTIVPVRAALAPMYLEGTDPELAGLALRDIVLKARAGGKEVARWRDDLLFTHKGISGPTVLGISREVAEHPGAELTVDLFPELSFESLRDQWIAWAREHPRQMVLTEIERRLPERFAPLVAAAAGLTDSVTGSQLTQKQRNRLVEVLKAFPLPPVRLVVLEKGEVVAGGVSLDEVDPQTMESRKVPGLFLCGEILDVAGPVGGYNLQAAFATGHVAGESAAG